ncbi:MAG: hypothetical protein Tsb0014_47260 [Pleurocapsa sp.]
MLLYPVRNRDSGFTLIETLTALIIVGVIAAVAAPSLYGMLTNNRIKEGIEQVEGAIKEAQRQATKDGKSCIITTTDNSSSISGGCLLSARNFKDQIKFRSSNNTITFSGKGTIDISAGKPVFVIYASDSGTSEQKCLVIESSLGTIRTGDYTEDLSADPTATLDDTKCD